VPRAKERVRHIFVTAPNFKQILVDDYLWMDDGDRLRLVFGTHSAEDKKPGTHIVILGVEISLNREDGKAIAESITKWLKKQPRVGRRSPPRK
jgi:hypothetical protein